MIRHFLIPLNLLQYIYILVKSKVINFCCFAVFIIIRFLKSDSKKSSDNVTNKETINELEKSIMKRKAQLYEMEQSLPQKNSLYLKVCELLTHLQFHNVF